MKNSTRFYRVALFLILSLMAAAILMGCTSNLRVSETSNAYTQEYAMSDSQTVKDAVIFNGFRLYEKTDRGYFFVRSAQDTKSGYRATFEIAVVWFPDENTTRLHVWRQKRNHGSGLMWVENMCMSEIKSLDKELSIQR